MAIRDIQFRNVVADIGLKNESRHNKKDLPANFLNDSGSLISFWLNDSTIMVVPMSEVKYIFLYEDKENE